LLDAPSFENFADEDLAKFPSQIRSYLYSWELVFASYPKASFKVRNDYSEALKSGNYILPLFDFLFDLLGHSAGKPLNLDKSTFTPEQIRFYDDLSAHSDGEERNMQWLLINLYYLCLKFAPGLAKTWWMNCKSKQTRVAVESWTEKYFSPLVIADTMDEVATWSSQQQPELEDEKELIVKVSKNSREVYAGCEIDDMQMQIVIRLPATYPLEGVKVDGINRVAVSEKKWQSWLMITQGVITFSVRHPTLYLYLLPAKEFPFTDVHLCIYRTVQL
jgi:E3 ubiquitin-protein ligase listerin